MHKYELIREAIAAMAAEAGPGVRLPTEKEMARRFNASTMTVRRALQMLTENGLLRGVPGRGTFVARSRVTKVARASASFTEALRASGRRASSRLVSATLRPPIDDAEGDFFAVGEGGFVVEVRRVRLGDGIPIGFESAVLNAAIVPGILGCDLTGSLYELIEQQYQLQIERTGIVVSARLPEGHEAELLEVEPAEPCLQTVVTAQVSGGQNLERTVALYRGDMYELAI
ncbi:GntR family transcriptional regulator [Actinomyces marmotae]|uniref:GntR family transcriptional regulator n=1 Tax=Actinomyces marmotae TaxID=2737173 RepID=A0A6M8BA68_9ACTO|nr:GntR family transcriptional regulator [Actinomyces marmotae]QKD80133.1 GntR family transcriptional regulator [Actinomyces marmotae]